MKFRQQAICRVRILGKTYRWMVCQDAPLMKRPRAPGGGGLTGGCYVNVIMVQMAS